MQAGGTKLACLHKVYGKFHIWSSFQPKCEWWILDNFSVQIRWISRKKTFSPSRSWTCSPQSLPCINHIQIFSNTKRPLNETPISWCFVNLTLIQWGSISSKTLVALVIKQLCRAWDTALYGSSGSYGDLVQRSCQQTSYRDLANKALIESCQEPSYRDLIRRHCKKICCRDLAKRSLT